jgi:hypothetical protein
VLLKLQNPQCNDRDSVFVSYLKLICYRMFKINKHTFNNYIFAIILYEFGYEFFYLLRNYGILYQTLSRPNSRPPATVIWVAT